MLHHKHLLTYTQSHALVGLRGTRFPLSMLTVESRGAQFRVAVASPSPVVRRGPAGVAYPATVATGVGRRVASPPPPGRRASRVTAGRVGSSPR